MPGFPTGVWQGEIGEFRAATSAGGGSALTTAPIFIPVPDATAHLDIIPRNFNTSTAVAQVALNPYLTVLKTMDNLATDTDYSQAAQQPGFATTVNLDSLATLANKGFILVGSWVPFRGVNIAVTTPNAVVSTLTVKYWNGSSWVTTSATDGTASGGATLAVAGNVSWTVPSAWTLATLINTGLSPSSSIPSTSQAMYWTRWEVSATLSATTRLTSMLAMNRSTAYAELLSGQIFEEMISKGIGGFGCVEAQMSSGTGNVVVNVASRFRAPFLS